MLLAILKMKVNFLFYFQEIIIIERLLKKELRQHILTTIRGIFRQKKSNMFTEERKKPLRPDPISSVVKLLTDLRDYSQASQ